MTTADSMDAHLQKLLSKLDLISYYPKNLKLSNVLVVDLEPPVGTESKELAFVYFRKLMMLDYTARHLVKQTQHSSETYVVKPTHDSLVSERASSCTMDDFFADFDGIEDQLIDNCGNLEEVHPMDLQMAIIYCADDFVKRYVFGRLSTCQYAVPLIVPSASGKIIECNIWCCRDIKVMLPKATAGDSATGGGASTPNPEQKRQYTIHSAVQVKVPVISFLRFSSSPVSKSQLLNLIVNGKKHHTFFNRDCLGGTHDCRLMGGVVETFWYSPSNNNDCVFDTCITFMNLHGEALTWKKQRQFLNDISSVIVLLVSEADYRDKRELLESYFLSPKPVIFLQTHAKKQHTSTKSLEKKVRISLHDRNEADLRQELVGEINRLVGEATYEKTLEDYSSVALKYCMCVDEVGKDCTDSKQSVCEMLNTVKSIDISKVKQTFLPLQGPTLWQEWCGLDRSLTSIKEQQSKGIESHRSEIESQKKLIRKRQVTEATKNNPLTSPFIETIVSLNNERKLYFLKWLKDYLDDIFTPMLYQLEQEYHSKWSQCNGGKERISDIDDVRDKYSVGVEHIFRELGQIYEATEGSKYSIRNRNVLPKVMAELLVQGHPMELMDGDAAYVATQWINEVLTHLSTLINNARIYVLSVLGLQSSGKSTLMNALFGVQFAVSAGRCTRGVFMQLLKVSERLREQLSVEYILVVDTEGLKSTELSHQLGNKHDNKLATFVIGLASMTVINIFGENPADIQDILQISVQAFMRMKQVNIKPSCVFVHQCIGDPSAGEKNSKAIRSLQSKLDDMTKLAAKEEQCDVERFTDVIQFDINKQTFYFAHLWEGNPPMSPPNPAYSSNVQQLKAHLLSTQTATVTISQFQQRVFDLWTALRYENFVFSFKNSVEISEYNKLESRYSHWCWELRKTAKQVEDKITNQLTSGMLLNAGQVREKITNVIAKKFDETRSAVKAYFDETESGEVRVQWRATIDTSITSLKNELIIECCDKCTKQLSNIKARRRIDSQIKTYEEQMLEHSRSLAASIKGKGKANDHETMKREFEGLWTHMLAEIRGSIPPTETKDVLKDVQSVLLQVFGNYSGTQVLVNKYGKTQGLQVDLTNSTYYIAYRQNAFVRVKKWFAGISCKSQTESVREHIESQVNRFISQTNQKALDYDANHVYRIVWMIKDMVSDFNQQEHVDFQLSKDFIRDISFAICLRSVDDFKAMQRRFLDSTSPITYFEQKKSNYFKTFIMFCQNVADVVVIVERVGDELESAVRKAVKSEVSMAIAQSMKTENKGLSQNRIALEYAILVNLAKGRKFDAVNKYIHFPKRSMEEFIGDQVRQFFENPGRVKSIVELHLKRIISRLEDAVDLATDDTASQTSGIDHWLTAFVYRISEFISMTMPSNLTSQSSKSLDLDFLREQMRTTVARVKTVLEAEMKETSMFAFICQEYSPENILVESFQGCWEMCPGCKALCVNTIPGHQKHSVPFHRSQAVNGWHFHKQIYFSVAICSSLVGSERSFIVNADTPEEKIVKWNRYWEAGPRYASWSIKPDPSELNYWKWVVCHFKEDFEKYYDFKFEGIGEIPATWWEIKEGDAIASLIN